MIISVLSTIIKFQSVLTNMKSTTSISIKYINGKIIQNIFQSYIFIKLKICCKLLLLIYYYCYLDIEKAKSLEYINLGYRKLNRVNQLWEIENVNNMYILSIIKMFPRLNKLQHIYKSIQSS